MKTGKTSRLWNKTVAIMFGFVLLVTGVCFVGFIGDEVQAEETIVISSDGRYGTVPVNDVIEDSEGIPVYDNYLFAGWMKENSDGTLKVVSSKSSATYAKFVPEELLTIKAQSTQAIVSEVENSADGNKYAGKYVLRFVSSVESLDYYNVGFEVIEEDGTKHTNTTDDVCYRIDSTTSGAEFTFSPKVMDVESEYFITAKFPVEPGENNENLDDLYTVRAFWTTLDGKTVYGAPRCLSVSDGLQTATTLNVSFLSNTEVTENQSLSVAYDDEEKTATIIGYDAETKTAHARITFDSVADKASLKSVTQFEFSTTGEGAESLGSVKYRNLYTKYTESKDEAGNITSNTADTTWYDANETEFVIATSADLYGLAKIVNGDGITSDTFANDTIYVVSDIEVNKGQATKTGWITTKDANGTAIEDESGTDFQWTPIGTKEIEFAGTFDGNMHTISGIYLETDEQGAGLFKNTAVGSTIKNLELKNSYLASTAIDGCVGSIVGACSGNLEKIYSDAILDFTTRAGGLVGEIWSSGDVNITECWYDGNMSVSAAGGSGGIVGIISTGDVTMKDCLYTGRIDGNVRHIGGLCGRTLRSTTKWETTDKAVEASLNVKACLSAGTISSTAKYQVGSVVGHLQHFYTDIVSDVYATDQVSDYYGAYKSDGTDSTYGKGKATVLKESDFVGNCSYFNTGLDFVNTWALVEGDTPILKCFADVVPELPVVPENADISWYEGPKDYTICDNQDNAANVKELYGFAYLVGQGISFNERTVSLANNVTVNEEDRSTWNTSTGSGLLAWTPIGTLDTPFAGTFDGNDKTISGVYAKADTDVLGLFAATAEGSIIQNLNLENSYLKNSATITGSIVGQCAGNLVNVYSNAYVESGAYGGGLVGKILTDSKDSRVNITRCWFDGDMKAQGNYQGGIVGYIMNGTINITDCLNTGDINCNSKKRIGGLCGGVIHNEEDDSSLVTLQMEKCLNYGTITNYATSSPRAATIVGNIGVGTAGTIANVYATNECFVGAEAGVGYGYKANTSDIEIQIQRVPEANINLSLFETWGFDAAIWTIDTTNNTPALIMTTLVTE